VIGHDVKIPCRCSEFNNLSLMKTRRAFN